MYFEILAKTIYDVMNFESFFRLSFRQWPTGQEYEEEGNTKPLISQERKELFT